jgi:single-strand DNA-binding protein
MNRVMLLGNLGADPDLKATNGGSVLKLRVATTESYLDKNNTRQERTEWHSVVMFGKRAEALARILAKGERVFVEGGLRTSSYEKDGEKRYRTEIVASNVILNGAVNSPNNAPRTFARSSGNGRAPAPAEDVGDYPGGDDVPF